MGAYLILTYELGTYGGRIRRRQDRLRPSTL